MRCPQCDKPGVQYVIDAYVVYDDLTDDGAQTAGPPRVETFDNAFLECPDCGWKLEKVEVRIVDRTLHDEIQ